MQQEHAKAPAGATLGIVIALPAPLAEQLGRLRAAYGDPLAEAGHAHITLITGGPTGGWSAARDHAAAVAARTPHFTVRLRGIRTFRPVTEVVYLPLVEGAQACSELHAALSAGPLEHQTEFDYHPHVTVAKDAPAAELDRALLELADFQADFPVSSIELFAVDAQGMWTFREELRLGTA